MASFSMQPRWSESILITRLPMVLMALLGLMAAWLMVRLLWLMMTGPGEVELNNSDGLMIPSSKLAQQGMPGRYAFWAGIFGDDQTSMPLISERLPVDQGAYTLVGVMAHSTGSTVSAGYAIIRSNGLGDRLYQVDDVLPDGRRVSRIEKDQVILEGRVGQERLILRDRPSQSAPSSSSTAQLPQPAPLPAGIGIASVGGLGHQLAVSPGADQTGYTSLTPVAGGGYRLRPGPEVEVFIAAGLQVGDLLLSVNGQPIEDLMSDPAVAMRWMQSVEQGQSLALTVERQGQQITVQPSVQQVRDALNNRKGLP